MSNWVKSFDESLLYQYFKSGLLLVGFRSIRAVFSNQLFRLFSFELPHKLEFQVELKAAQLRFVRECHRK